MNVYSMLFFYYTENIPFCYLFVKHVLLQFHDAIKLLAFIFMYGFHFKIFNFV